MWKNTVERGRKRTSI